MYRSINYLIILFITFLSLKTIKTEPIDLKNNLTQSTFKYWWNEKHVSPSTNIENDSSFEICIPFHTCHTELNRTILTILFLTLLLMCCFYYHCHECCQIKNDLDKLQSYRRTEDL